MQVLFNASSAHGQPRRSRQSVVSTPLCLTSDDVPSASGPPEKEGVVHFINEVGERWRSVSVELQCLRSMLEEVQSGRGWSPDFGTIL